MSASGEAMICEPIMLKYTPSRKATKNRVKPLETIGIYLMYPDERLQIRYTYAFDIDKKVTRQRLQQIIETIKKHLKCDIPMICETSKGYHIYISKFWYNPYKTYAEIMKLRKHVPEFDYLQLKLGFMRLRKIDTWAIIRVGGKYETPDIKVIYFDPSCINDLCHRSWIKHVYLLIKLYNEVSQYVDIDH